ncbi:SRPBCC family protein [Cryptosporangium minutisporangium]|uniref:Coenzyme Q-binding protein COQ10 START domain-containing protein n=1 Tax=Cryptosporangium minutisporangium TaxID=113569 RepID=A0ABP6T9W7_9ACTN
MSTIERSIDVHVPVRTAYDQWTQFETFPQFMEGVENIQQIDDVHTHWRTNIAGVRREFDAEITEQRPDERVAWKATDGEEQAGVVTFHRLDDENTRIMLQLEFHPEGAVEKAGDALGLVSHRVKGDLERFKTFIEAHGSSTGAWRGEVDAPPQRGAAGTGGQSTDASATGGYWTPRTEEDPNAMAHGVPPMPSGSDPLTNRSAMSTEDAQRAFDEGRPAGPLP